MSYVAWMLELQVQAGKEPALRDLMAEMVAATSANEPGTLHYEWNMSGDGQSCHLYERYADSAAAMQHIATFGEKYAERFFQVLQPTRFVIYGSPTPDVKAALAGFGPTYMTQVAGFSR